MNTKSFLFSFIAVMLAASMATAGTRYSGGNHFMPGRAGSVHSGRGAWQGGHWSGGNWNDRRGGGNWNGRWGGDWHHHHHHHDFNDFVFVGSFGFPFWGYPGGWGYPYGYGYPYGSGYYGYGPGYGYGQGYYGSASYRSSYSGSGYGYGDNRSQTSVARLQQRLARAGYYRGPVDGIMGPRTRYALRAYQHDRGTGQL